MNKLLFYYFTLFIGVLFILLPYIVTAKDGLFPNIELSTNETEFISDEDLKTLETYGSEIKENELIATSWCLAYVVSCKAVPCKLTPLTCTYCDQGFIGYTLGSNWKTCGAKWQSVCVPRMSGNVCVGGNQVDACAFWYADCP